MGAELILPLVLRIPPGPSLTDPAACPPTPECLLGPAGGDPGPAHLLIDGRGNHQLSHYSLAGAWGHGTGMSHVSVLKEDVSAVAATSIINTPCAGVGGKVDGFIPPLLELHSPSPMSPHLSP